MMGHPVLLASQLATAKSGGGYYQLGEGVEGPPTGQSANHLDRVYIPSQSFETSHPTFRSSQPSRRAFPRGLFKRA